MPRAAMIRTARTPITTPAMAPPERPPPEEVPSVPEGFGPDVMGSVAEGRVLVARLLGHAPVLWDGWTTHDESDESATS